MLVAGSMIGSGSGIFIVAADIARQVGSPPLARRDMRPRKLPRPQRPQWKTYTEPLGTRKGYGEALAACGGREDGQREGDRGHRARRDWVRWWRGRTLSGVPRREGGEVPHRVRDVLRRDPRRVEHLRRLAGSGHVAHREVHHRTISPATLAFASGARTASLNPPSTLTTQSRPSDVRSASTSAAVSIGFTE